MLGNESGGVIVSDDDATEMAAIAKALRARELAEKAAPPGISIAASRRAVAAASVTAMQRLSSTRAQQEVADTTLSRQARRKAQKVLARQIAAKTAKPWQEVRRLARAGALGDVA